MILMASCIAAFGLVANSALAQQQRGNFDPAQFRQRMMDGIKERLEVTDDAEWKVLEPAIGKVFDAQTDLRSGNVRFGGRPGGNRPPGGDNANNGDTNNNNRRRGGFGGTPSSEAEALQKAIEDKAPADEVKSKMAALRASNKAKEEKLAAAQEDLKKLLTARQEAMLVLSGLLK